MTGRRAHRTAPAVATSGAAALLLAGVVLPLGPAARADDITAADPPSFTTAQLAESITALDPGTSALAPGRSTLEKNIEPVDTETTDGEQTVLTLQSDILFAYGESTIDDTARDRVAELVADVPQDATVSVHGHTDSKGDEPFNQTLSEQRAQTVADAIAAPRPHLVLDVRGFGETDPVAPNENGGEDNPEGRAENRRVEIRYEGA